MVTYGGLSKEPVSVPTGLLIFNDVRLRGFWLTGSSAEADHEVEYRRRVQEEILRIAAKVRRIWKSKSVRFPKRACPLSGRSLRVTLTRDPTSARQTARTVMIH